MDDDELPKKIDTSVRYQPEPDIKDFPDRRNAKPKDLENFDFEKVRPLAAKVINFLMLKALHEKRKQDKMNPTQLGNVRFHIQYNERTKESRLVFSLHPKQWRVKEIIKDLDRREAEIVTERHFNQEIMNDPFHNPFTF